MHDHLACSTGFLKMPRVLNKPGFWLWQGRTCKGYAEFRICLITAAHVSVMPEYALMPLNGPENA